MDELARQEEEMQALASIYESQFQRLDDVLHNPRYSITVYPGESHGGEAYSYTRVDLVVTYCNRYPLQAPVLSLENAAGLNIAEQEELIETLQLEAQRRTTSATGEVFVYELVQMAESFLRKHNRRDVSGLHEMRIRQQRAREAEEGAQALERRMEEQLARESWAHELDEQERIQDERRQLQEKQDLLQPKLDDALLEIDDHFLAPEVEMPRVVKSEGRDDDQVDMLLANLADRTKSRWETDFKELEFLGSGGFGEVVKARNRLDRYDYAVKKVHASAHECQKILEEVVSLKRLEHPYIVRYYSAWIERGANAAGQASCMRTSSRAEDEEKLEDLLDEDPQDFCDQGDWNWMITPSSASGPGRYPRDNVYDGEDSSSESEADYSTRVGICARDSQAGDIDIVFDRTLHTGTVVDDRLHEGSDDRILDSKPLLGHRPRLKWRSGEVESDRCAGEPSEEREWCLFIQMEYCKLTLRKVIDDTDNGLWKFPREVWRLFRQILEALDHMHKSMCIHRDLKPNNIFLAQNGMGAWDIRIGDFGLVTEAVARTSNDSALKNAITSRPSTGRTDPQEKAKKLSREVAAGELCSHPVENGTSTTSPLEIAHLTGGVGTAIYRAPEQERGGEYDATADIFSCGIVMFEMVSEPFSTGMERLEALTCLRNDGRLPDGLVQRLEKEKNAGKPFDSCYRALDVIKAMVQHDRGKRPTAESLLKPGVLPVAENVAKDYEKDFSVITHPSNTSYSKLIDSLFTNLVQYPSPNPLLELQYDRNVASEMGRQGVDVLEAAVLRQVVTKCLTRVFESHAAIPVYPPLFRPRGVDEQKPIVTPSSPLDATRGTKEDTGGRESKSCATSVVDGNGFLLRLPENLTTPFARMAARSNISNIKRYQLGPVFFDGCRDRLDSGKKSPVEAFEADFDILQDAEPSRPATESSPRATFAGLPHVCEAETILVALRIMTVFRPYLRTSFLKLNNIKMSAALFELLGLPKSRTGEARRMLRRVQGAQAPGGRHVNRPASDADDALQQLKALVREFDDRRSFDGALASIRSLSAFVDNIPRVQQAVRAGMDSRANHLTKEFRKVLHLRASLQSSAKALSETISTLKVISQFVQEQFAQKHGSDRWESVHSAPGSGKRRGSKGKQRKEGKRKKGLRSTRATFLSFPVAVDILVSLDLTLTSKVYRSGLVFQIQLESNEKAANAVLAHAADTVAEGGRYDSMISNFRRPGYVRLRSLEQSSYRNPHPTVAVGLHFSVDKLCVALGLYLKATEHERRGRPFEVSAIPPLLPAAAPQVVVTSMDGLSAAGLLQRMKISSSLWAAGVRVNFVVQTGKDGSQVHPHLFDLLGSREDRPAGNSDKCFRLPQIASGEDIAGLAQSCAAHGVLILVVILEDHEGSAQNCAVCVLSEKAAAWDSGTTTLFPQSSKRISLNACLAAATDTNPVYGPHPDPVPAISQRVHVNCVPTYVCRILRLLQPQHTSVSRNIDASITQHGTVRDQTLTCTAVENPIPVSSTPTVPSSTGNSEEHNQPRLGLQQQKSFPLDVFSAVPCHRDTKRPFGAARSLRGVKGRAEDILSALCGCATGRSDVRGGTRTAVIVSPLRYLLIRDIGTAVARSRVTEQEVQVPDYRKNDAEAVQCLIKTIEDVLSSDGSKDLHARRFRQCRTILLYSSTDDRFDMVSL